MPRRKSADKCSILPWLSAKPDSREGRFTQIGNSLLLSPKFKELTTGARSLYISMAMEAGGQREFEFPRTSAIKYGFPTTTFERLLKELLSVGCIVLKSSGKNTREANVYTFSVDYFKDT